MNECMINELKQIMEQNANLEIDDQQARNEIIAILKYHEPKDLITLIGIALKSEELS